MRTKNPEQRQVAIRWSTKSDASWTPEIAIVPARGLRGTGRAGECRETPSSFGLGLLGMKPAKCRQTTLIWKRDGMRTGTRPMWR